MKRGLRRQANPIDDWLGITFEGPKDLEAYKIIQEKGLNIKEFERSHNANEYNNACKGDECKSLTQEEYVLLKETLNEDELEGA